jgi:hypothetical protein
MALPSSPNAVEKTEETTGRERVRKREERDRERKKMGNVLLPAVCVCDRE